MSKQRNLVTEFKQRAAVFLKQSTAPADYTGILLANAEEESVILQYLDGYLCAILLLNAGDIPGFIEFLQANGWGPQE